MNKELIIAKLQMVEQILENKGKEFKGLVDTLIKVEEEIWIN